MTINPKLAIFISALFIASLAATACVRPTDYGDRDLLLLYDLTAGAESDPCQEIAMEEGRNPTPAVTADELAELVRGNNRFALDIYPLLESSGNIIFSPYSISAALSMAYGGARNVTADEISEAMNFTLDSDRHHAAFNALDLGLLSSGCAGGARLNIANALWGEASFHFLDTFNELLTLNYGAPSRPTDFMNDSAGAIESINNWADEKGTEAAAVTFVSFWGPTGNGSPGHPYMRLNRPFIYFIEDNVTGSILFMGRVEAP